jgi:hypothetical protein
LANKTSKSNEAYFARYKTQGIRAKNKKLKLERALRRNPENKQIETALASIISYGRKTPTTPKWSHTDINRVMLEKLFKKPGVQPVKTHKLSDYSIGARAHDKVGNLIWV